LRQADWKACTGKHWYPEIRQLKDMKIPFDIFPERPDAVHTD
jgi:hypothetical protein